ncbi:hypothetical protein UFOVP1463_17 [uncultured Caudovirales phage]|uniref:Uncharacterized protein n=1 Tax=uncultured Caudovirales phage TaxID=2100421 RepID=A0A6J5QGA9_9CAUD|nr:hypothetical protein UFOVP1102_3 [uncultured Caudovirales phage]CAB4213988.1 hypothetical protein UFOVP1463_17 [uncultured Caudovirales phage]
MNYKETNITGTSWTRCRTVTITNPLPGTGVLDVLTGIPVGPRAYFQEEEVLAIASGKITSDAGSCYKDFDPTATIPLLNVATEEPTGATISHTELYQILYSLYILTAKERDQ